jgi:hypothetical protein
MLLAYRKNPSFCAGGQRLGVHRPRPGKEPTITPEAKAWLVSLVCDKAKDHDYPLPPA